MDSNSPKKVAKWTRVLAIASSIVGLISFGMFVTTYIIQKKIEAEQKRQQEAFLRATSNFTELLNSKNEQLQTLSNKLSTLDRMKAQVDRIHERVVRRSDVSVNRNAAESSRASVRQIYAQ